MSSSSSLVMGDCHIKSVNEIGYKLQLKNATKEIVLARKGGMFRLHLADPAADEQLVIIECLGDDVFLKVEEDGKVIVTDDFANSTRFRLCKGKYFAGALSLETTGAIPRLWLRHHSWRLRADPDKTGQSFNMDAAFFFEEPNKPASPAKRKRAKSPELLKRAKSPELLKRPKSPEPQKRPKAGVDRARLEALEREREELNASMTITREKYENMRKRYTEVKELISALQDKGD